MRWTDTVKLGSKGWQTVKLGDIAQFRNGLNYTKENFGRGLKVINVKDFQNHLIASYGNLDEINPEGIIRDEDLLRVGDIVFVRSNGNRELIGRSLLIEKLNEPVSHSAFTIKLRFNTGDAFPKFFAYLFRTSLIRQTLSAHGNGANISNLNQGILSSLEVFLPPVSTQRRIAAILSAYDDLIENNTRRIQILEEMARRIYEEWFVQFRFPGHENVRMIESELGLIPDTWKVKRLGEVVELVYGKALKADEREAGNVPVYGSSGVVGFHNVPLVNEAGIIVGRKGNVGSVHLSDVPFYPIDTVYYTKTELPLSYVFFNLKRQNFINNDAAVPGLNRNQAHSLPFLLPEENVLQKFDELTKDLFGLSRKLQAKNNNLRSTRDLLLPKLISGEIDVSNFPEPMSD
ncbi:MAG TPA: restriction endonuclease subunit S [Pyrinomonadaceae bacterium]|nr:restriction endonuclease subunit S [Pyrinomonadaceae bacterium]